ncbi:hypothetical protein [Streptomyces sp. NPDC050738]|uniref:hypothetical protein n=1 Tax=Streptomyces sp. NPDC050738 TaxID=3154744 RepID=UPI003428210B
MGILPDFTPKGAKPGPKGEAKQIPVEVVAEQAVKQLELPKPVIHTSPSENFVQVVHVPTWMWVDQVAWNPVSKTAKVPGVSVTATARPRRAVWVMGEGGRVVCEGAGTPYSSKYRPDQASPDCGYTYAMASLDAKGRKFTVSVTVSWDVTWEGGGQAGQVPGQVVTAEQQLVVDEVQAIVMR